MEHMAGSTWSVTQQGQTSSYELIAQLQPMQCENVLNHVIIHQSDFVSSEAVMEAKLALWEGLRSSPLGLCKALQLWQLELQYVIQPNKGKFKVFLSSKNLRGCEINIGECATLQDVSEIEATLHACKTDFARTIKFFVTKMGASPPTFVNLDIHSLMSSKSTPRDVWEVGSSSNKSHLPTTLNRFSKKPAVIKKYYGCCKLMEESRKKDFVLFKKMECRSCHSQVHTECALKRRELYLRKNIQTGMETSFYKCPCGTLHKVMLPNMLLLVKEFVEEIRTHHKSAQPGSKVIELPNGRELGVVMEVIQKILAGARTEFLLSLSKYIDRMKLSLTVTETSVNFEQWISFVDTALLYLKPDAPGPQDQMRGRSKEAEHSTNAV